MLDLKEIKEKMEEFLKDFKNINTPDEAIEKFKQIFDGEYYERFTDVDEPYYECHTQRLYLQNGYGIGIEKSWGPFDFAGGGVVSHEGEDLHIFSELADEYIMLFEFSKKEKISNNVDSLFNIDLSTKNILSVDDDLIFNFIPENELENTEELFNGRYNNLKRKAELDYNNDVDNDLISYYGGLDVIIHSTEYYLYNSLLKSKYNENFMKKAIPLFNKDFPKYFDTEIEECKQALYIIDNKDKYYELINYNEQDFKSTEISVDFLEDIELKEREKCKLQLKLANALNTLNDIKHKRYNFIDFFKGTKKKDFIQSNNIQKNIDLLKNQLEAKIKELDVEKSNYENYKKEIKMNKEQFLKIKEELKYPFKDFTLIPEIECEPYIDGEYYLEVSLDRLINKQYFYTQKLQELKFMKDYANSKNLKIEKEKEELYEKEI